MIRFVCMVAVLCCCGAAVADDSVLVQTPTQAQPTDVQQQPMIEQPAPQIVGPTVQMVPTGPSPIWVLKKKMFGNTYRAKPGWLYPQVVTPQVTPQVVTPQVVVPQVVTPTYMLPTYYYRVPQPTIIYRPEVIWR